MKAIHFPDWLPVRDALDAVYQKLGLEMERAEDGSGSSFPARDWNIAGLIREYVVEHQTGGKCTYCSTKLTYSTVIRCLDCGAPMCTNCARPHFGPGHQMRKHLSHPESKS